MGFLVYGSARSEIELDDRLLAHLEPVIVAKLRRNESFIFTVITQHSSGFGRRAMWFRTDMDLEFSFSVSTPLKLNRRWVEELMEIANSAQGLRVVPEPEPATNENRL